MSDWSIKPIKEVASINRKSISRDYNHKTISYLDTGSITKGKIDSFQELGLSEAPSRAKRLVDKYDIVYSLVRPNLEHYGILKAFPENLVVSTGFATITANRNLINPEYLYYYLTQSWVTDYLYAIAEGSTSTYPSLRPEDIEKLEVEYPSMDVQEAIAEILSSLDDKIDLLHRNNKTLEALAETLFRQWFIEEADDKWELTTVESAFETKGGGTPATTDTSFWNGDIYWTSPRDLSSGNAVFMTQTQRTITIEGLKKISSGLLPVGTVLLSSRAPIGYLAITEVPVAINQGYIACLANDKYSPWYIHSWLKENMELIHGVSNGSTFMEISKGAFRKLPFVIPSDERLYAYNEIAESWYKKILLNEKQIAQLQLLRDRLLPKLMNGTIKVNELAEA